MRLLARWLGNDGKPIETSRGKRYQVRWRLLVDGSSRIVERKRSDFKTKAAAQYFMEELDKAHHGLAGPDGRRWRFDTQGHPTNLRARDTTVIGAIDQYVHNRWFTEWQASQRSKVRGRMLIIAIQLTDLPKGTKQVLLDAVVAQRGDRGARPTPTTREEWAARWLRDHAFFPNREDHLIDEMAAAREWLEAHSKPLCSLGVNDITELRVAITGGSQNGPLEHSTRGDYWSGITVPFLTWLYESALVDKSLTRGQPKIKRDLQGERADPNLILEPSHVVLLAGWFRRHYDENWELFPMIATFCALRIGEALNIRLSDFVLVHDRWHLRLGMQIHATTKAYSDHGKGREESQLKSRRDSTPKTREIPLTSQLAERLVELFGQRLGRDNTHLFRGPRGAVGNTSDVRKWWEKALAEVVVPIAPKFAGLTPHAMRHAGMTYWFSQKFDEKLIQRWGGWKSVVVMQDTYRGVLESLERKELEGFDRFDEMWSFDRGEQSSKAISDLVAAKVVDLAEWRRRSRSA